MSNTELEHLIQMVNQIADNIAIGESDDVAAAKLADHIKRFWARSMKQQIIKYAETDCADLKPIAKQALALLQQGVGDK
jgi:formate dehydrogenase subunit delta